MKKWITLALVATLAVGMMGGGVADAAKKKKKKTRKVTFEYQCPCVGLYQFGGLTGENLGGGPVPTGAKEKYLTAEASDGTGMEVPVEVQGDLDGDGFNDAIGSFCTTTETPLAIPGGVSLNIFVGDPAVCGTPQVLSGGTIEFVFSNKP